MKDINCAYCMKDENPSLYLKFGYFAFETPTSNVYIFREQSHKGRCIVAYKDHVSEIVNISQNESTAFLADVRNVSKAIHKAFNPVKVNYGAYGDTGCHLHMHLCPKYKDEFEWGGVFEMNPHRLELSDEELDKIAKNLYKAYQEVITE